MKVALTLLIICLAMGFFLAGIGRNGEQQQSPKPKLKTQTTTQTTEEDLWKKLEEDRLKGYMTAGESRIWLAKNHYQVQKKTDGNGYIITCNYYDPGPPSTRYDTRTEISGRGTTSRGTTSISGPTSALVTIDAQGQLRVAPSATQQ